METDLGRSAKACRFLLLLNLGSTQWPGKRIVVSKARQLHCLNEKHTRYVVCVYFLISKQMKKQK